jgi:hypothetical protein
VFNLTLAEIKENNLRCVIKVDSKKEAVKLLEIFNPNGYDANYAYDYLMGDYWKGDGTVCFNVVGNKINGFDTETYYKKNENQYGKIYRFSDLFATGGFCDGFRGGKISSDLIVSHTEMERAMDMLLKALEKPSVKFGIKKLEQKLKKEKNLKFTFYVKEGTRVDKTCNKLIPTMTTFITAESYGDSTYHGAATCDKADYDERQGCLEALANAMLGGNFDRDFNRAVKANELTDKKKRTCTYCGKVFDTVEEKQVHEAWHVERKKARRERYLLRKRAKEIAFEEQAQKMAKEMIEK